MSRRSEGDAMPGWSTILKVDKASLGLDEERDGDAAIADEGEELSPFDDTTEPPIVSPAPGRPSVQAVTRTPVPAAPSRVYADPASMGARAVSLPAADRPLENLTGDEFTQLDQPAPEELRMLSSLRKAPPTITTATPTPDGDGDGESTTLDQPLSEVLRPSAAVQVEGVVGERLPPVVVRRAPDPRASAEPESRSRLAAIEPESRSRLAAIEARHHTPETRLPDGRSTARGDAQLLQNAPVQGRAGPQEVISRAELTEINAAAALGIAPEPNAPAGLGPPIEVVEDKTPPPSIPRVDFGALKLAEKEEVLARYPVEAPGIGAAERLGEKVPTVRAVSKVLPVVLMAGIALSFVGVFLIGPLGDLLQAGERQSARDALRNAQQRATEEAEANALPAGSIRVTTQPSKAAVEVDGYYLGRSPMMIAPPEERPRYEFRISAEGHKTWQGVVRVESGGYLVESSEAESAGAGSLAVDGAHHTLVVTLEPN